MPSVRDILNALEMLAPARFAYPFDKVGLQIGDAGANVTKAVVSLDRSLGAIEFAAEHEAQLLLSHHPLVWEPLKSVHPEDYVGMAVTKLIRHQIAFVAAHTNWDAAPGGINDTLAAKLGLLNVRPFGTAAPVEQLKLVAFCPEESAQTIIDSASSAGAGVVGLYTRCAFSSTGSGTYFSGAGTNPSIGSAGETTSTPESRIEMVLRANLRIPVQEAIRGVHPYEEPALDFFQLADIAEQPIARLGRLPSPLTLRQLANLADSTFDTRSWSWGHPEQVINSVAVCGGAADDEWQNAQVAGADVLVTGEVKQHIGLEASESGFSLIAAGHFATEHPGCVTLRNRMAELVPEVDWKVFEPAAGASGRPQ